MEIAEALAGRLKYELSAASRFVMAGGAIRVINHNRGEISCYMVGRQLQLVTEDGHEFSRIVQRNIRTLKDNFGEAQHIARSGGLVEVIYGTEEMGLVTGYLVGPHQIREGVDPVLDVIRQGSPRTLTCPSCGEDRPRSAFTSDATKAVGRRGECSSCEYTRRGRHYHRNHTLTEARA
jgi:hypothetical protein